MKKESKTAQAVQRLKDGDLRGALSIFATFRYDFTKEERRTIQIAHETLSGHEKFYQSIGINTSKEVSKATGLLHSKYLIVNKLYKVNQEK